MAKKSQSRKKRKQRKPNVPVYTIPTQEATQPEAQPPTNVAAAAATTTSEASPQHINWAEEYPYFATDMKRLGLVVLLMVMLLLALNFLFIYVL
ncbi:MAG TPA: hypothetical protein ENK60_04870 [Anaerolineae bacterium]|nr:hypothetical protein [Anaerolineae bacterium]